MKRCVSRKEIAKEEKKTAGTGHKKLKRARVRGTQIIKRVSVGAAPEINQGFRVPRGTFIVLEIFEAPLGTVFAGKRSKRNTST